MPGWDEFKKGLGKIADKTASKTRELTDIASIKIKIASKEADRDAEYKTLGRLTYKKLKSSECAQGITERISACIEKLDKINEEIALLKAEEETKKAARQAAKEAKKAAQAEEEAREEAEAQAEEELVMEQFNKARSEADEEYEKAKQAAEDARKA